MSGTSIPSVIDNLITKIRGLSAITSDIPVFDGFPGPNIPDTFVAVGGGPESIVGGLQTYGTFAPQKWEDYEVSVWIQSYVGGDSATSTKQDASDAQRTARKNVLTIFQSIEAAILADPTLANGASAIVSNAEVGRFVLSETSELDGAESGMGRRASLNFYVHVRFMEAP